MSVGTVQWTSTLLKLFVVSRADCQDCWFLVWPAIPNTQTDTHLPYIFAKLIALCNYMLQSCLKFQSEKKSTISVHSWWNKYTKIHLKMVYHNKEFSIQKRNNDELLIMDPAFQFRFTVHQCFSNWAPRRGVRGSDRRKCVMVEGFYWRSKICMYEWKWQISFNYVVFTCYSFKMYFLISMVCINFNLIILFFYFLNCR